MSTVLGLAGLTAADYQFALKNNQALVYEAVQMYNEQASLARRTSAALFVQGTTERVQERVQLTITGRMARRSRDGNADAIRRTGFYDVAFPLEDYGDSVNLTDVDLAYTNAEEFDAHITGINARADNTYRHEILRRIFRNTNDTFEDEQNGELTIRALANGSVDSVLYPPVVGSDSEATQNHYLTTGYTAANISNTNNPVKTAADKLILRYGRRTGGIPIVTLINSAQRGQLEALQSFIEYVPDAIEAGANTDRVRDIDNVPGEIIGYMNSSWVAVWDWIPANYMISVYMNAPAPLVERVDPATTGLPSGLHLVEQGVIQIPHVLNQWRYRFGIGTRERLNGIVTFIDGGSSYTIPSDYS